jgi:hypothetical protein
MNGRTLRGLASVGTPHFGTPAADNIRRGYMPLLAMPATTAFAFLDLVYNPPDPYDMEEWFLLNRLTFLGGNIVNIASTILGLAEFSPQHPLWNAVTPSSLYLQTLNSPSALTQQSQRASVRGAIRTRISLPHQAFWRLLFSQQSTNGIEAARAVVAATAVFAMWHLGDKYCFALGTTFDPLKCANAVVWPEFALQLSLMDLRYCHKLFNENSSGLAYDSCGDSDAVVPYENQAWGALGSGYSLDYPVDNVSHVEQTSSPFVRERLEQFLVATGLSRCGSGPTASLHFGTGSSALTPGTTVSIPITRRDACSSVTTFSSTVTAASSDPAVLRVDGVDPGFVTVTGLAPGAATLHVVADGRGFAHPVSVVGGAYITVELSHSPTGSLLPGDEVIVSSNITSGSSVVSYEWRVNGVPITHGAASYSLFYTGPTTLSMTVRNSAGGEATATITF